MDVIIRKAVVEDAQQISDVIKDSMGFYNPPEGIADSLKRILCLDTDLVLVAVIENEIVGIVHAENYTPLYSSPMKDLMSLAVKTKYQNMKIGTNLMCEVEKWATETGRCGIQVLSRVEFTDAHKFYQSLGYKLEKTQLNFLKIF